MLGAGYIRDPQSGRWFKESDGGIVFDPRSGLYYSVSRKATATTDTGPWFPVVSAEPSPPANASAAAPLPLRQPLTPANAAAECCCEKAGASSGGADELMRGYRKMPRLERIRFFMMLDETEQDFDLDTVAKFNGAPLDRRSFEEYAAKLSANSATPKTRGRMRARR